MTRRQVVRNQTAKMDPKLVARKQTYEVQYLADRLKVSPALVRKAIAQVGNSRKKVSDFILNGVAKKPAAKKKAPAKKPAAKKARAKQKVSNPAPVVRVVETSMMASGHLDGMTDVPADLLREIEADAGVSVAPDKIARIREVAQDVIFKKDKATALAEQVSKLKAEIRDIEMKTLPDLLDQAGVPAISLAADGNVPALEIEVKPHFAANIAAGWDPEKRTAGFDYLEATGNGSLIKTELIVSFDKTDHARANKLAEALRTKGLSVEVRNSVHPATLTSWLKTQVTKVRKMPNLELIGGFVGREAKVKLGKAES